LSHVSLTGTLMKREAEYYPDSSVHLSFNMLNGLQ